MTNAVQHSRSIRPLPEFISIIGSDSCARIRIDDIEVIEQEGRKLHVITAGRDYTFYGALSSIAESLAERAFYRPIKSMIINLDHIEDITGAFINFSSGQSVTLGRNGISMTKKAYKRFLLRYPPYSLYEPIKRTCNFVSENKWNEYSEEVSSGDDPEYDTPEMQTDGDPDA